MAMPGRRFFSGSWSLGCIRLVPLGDTAELVCSDLRAGGTEPGDVASRAADEHLEMKTVEVEVEVRQTGDGHDTDEIPRGLPHVQYDGRSEVEIELTSEIEMKPILN